MLTQLYLLKTLSGLHCGVGHGDSDIDLPTARDPVTGHPYAPGSGLKGVLRRHFLPRASAALAGAFEAVFGPGSEAALEEPERSIDFASCVSFGDAHLVCLPVRSFHGTFAYLTSPTALKLFRADAVRAGCSALANLAIPEPATGDAPEIALASAQSPLRFSPHASGRNLVLLEELDLVVNASHQAAANAWAQQIAALFQTHAAFDPALFLPRFAIAADAVFDFLCETALPVVARNSLNADGVADDGALWTEEFIPAEAILAGLLHAEPSRRRGHELTAAAALDYLAGVPTELQLGGKATTGRGLVSFVLGKPASGP